jgi:hypothetical protein
MESRFQRQIREFLAKLLTKFAKGVKAKYKGPFTKDSLKPNSGGTIFGKSQISKYLATLFEAVRTMRNVLLGLFSALLLLPVGSASSQIVTQNGRDTATGNYSGSGSDMKVGNLIRSGSSSPLVLKWSVIGTNLAVGSGWDLAASGVCDNQRCYTYDVNDNLFANGKRFTSLEYDNAAFNPTDDSYVLNHDFHIVFGTNNPPIGSSAYVRVLVQDNASGASRTLTFIATRNTSTSISTSSSTEDIVLYPNPAREAINVVYDAAAGVKTIAVYNLIGKLTGPIYKPATNGSAKISLEDMPSGVYFMRLMDANGRVVATRRFNHQ